ncbi:wax ester/triacylglycerol synthase family O-acyltransferase [Deltaproteobacteria bacterium TL4]
MRKRLSIQDWSFLRVESRETPMHIGILMVFKLPEQVNPYEFFKGIMENLRALLSVTSPFNQHIRFPWFGIPYWVTTEDSDIDYHFRHSALPQPGNKKQLMTFISRLHGTLLDRSRPLWELELIEGLENKRFAIYFKIHHAVIDGAGGMNLVKTILNKTPDEHTLNPLEKKVPKPKPQLNGLQKVQNLGKGLWKAAQVLPKILYLLVERRIRSLHPEMPLMPKWYMAPNSPFNVRISAQRRYTTHSFSIEAFKRVGNAVGATINDVALAVCSGAIRRYLLEQNQLPDKSINASIPVSIKSKDVNEGNAIGNLVCNLGTHITDPLERFRHIRQSMMSGKEYLSNMKREEIISQTVIQAFPAFLGYMLKIAHHLPLPFNVLVSNIPISKDRLYINGATLEDCYAVALIYDMQAMNITLTSYVDTLDFSLIACRTAIPDLDKLARYLDDSFKELEESVKADQKEK